MIPLIVRSHFSFMWGAASPELLVRSAKLCGFNRVAMTDTDNLYGMWEFIKECGRQDVSPIVGAEVTDKKSPRRVVCIAKDDEGFKNLCRLITRRNCCDAFDLMADLAAYAPGLLILSIDEEMLTALKEAGADAAAFLPRKPSSATFKTAAVAKRLGLPCVATPSSFFLHPEDHRFHLLLRAIHGNTSFSRLRPGDFAPPDAYLASAVEYERRFAATPEALKATRELAERITFTRPNYGLVMPPFASPDGRSADEILREKTYDGARSRYGDELHETIVGRVERELKEIKRMGFSSYFLTVDEIVKRSPRICGRGSGAASIVAYCLGITNVCPIKFNLYFERFLNPGRKDPPDIDVDFSWDERDDVIFSTLEQFKGRAAMVSCHIGFQPRMAIRETAKVFGLTDAEIGQVSKRLPWFWRAVDEGDGNDALLERMKALPQLKELDFPEPWPEIMRLAQKLIGTPRHVSVHPGGIVITPRPIDEYAPIEIAPKGAPIIQWEKDGAEDAGLVKIDLLGNRSLGVIRDAIENVRQCGQVFEASHWEPEDDAATQARVAQGETMGCFYIESPATKLLSKKARTGDYEHLVIHSSIIRPAANRYIKEYVRRLHGGAWEPIHPLLEGVLDETYGIMVYQEDVSKTAVAIAGFSHADADGLRKVMSKKDRDKRLPDYFRRFQQGARERGVTDDQITQIWDMILSFDGYSFCKPHSASYARVSFQAAYLKEHFPAQFMSAVISNQGGFYSPFAYVSEARRMGLKILPPDVNDSGIRWRGLGETMRVGWLSVKHLSEETQLRIMKERAIVPFGNIIDFLQRVRPSEEEARSLIYARAFESLHPGESVASLLWELALWLSRRSKASRKGGMFEPKAEAAKPPDRPDDPVERLRREFGALGFLCDLHPITLFERSLSGKNIIKAKDVHKFAGKRVRVAGFLITGKVVSSNKGEPMEFITFDDETGIVETTFFPNVYRRFCHTLDYFHPYVLEGVVEEEFGAVTLTVNYAEACK